MDRRNQDSYLDRAHADDFLHHVMLEQNSQASDEDDDGIIVSQCIEHDAENCERCNETEPDMPGPDRGEWKHEAAAAQRLK